MKRIGAFLLTFVMLLGVLPTGIVVKADAAVPTNILDTTGLSPEGAMEYVNVIHHRSGRISECLDSYGYMKDKLDFGFAGGCLVKVEHLSQPVLFIAARDAGAGPYSNFVYWEIWGLFGNEAVKVETSGKLAGDTIELYTNGSNYYFGATKYAEFSSTTGKQETNYSEVIPVLDEILLTDVSAEGLKFVESLIIYENSNDILFDPNGEELLYQLNNVATTETASGNTGKATSSMSYLGGAIPYYGDASKMQLSAEVAEAYTDLIRAEYWSKGVVYVAMFDGGNGVPMIWIASGNGGNENYIEDAWGDKVYTCVDGQVQEINKWISALVRPGENGIVVQEWDPSDFATHYACLRLSNGRVADEPFASGTWNPLDAVLNGEDIDKKREEFVAQMGVELDYLISATSGLSGYLHLTGEWCDGYSAATTLESLADAGRIKSLDSKLLSTYRGIVQKAVNQYGVYIKPEDFTGDITPGVAAVYIYDVTNDGKEELFLFTTGTDMGEGYMMDVKVYSCDSGSCKEIYSEGVGAYFELRGAAGSRYLHIGETRHFYYPFVWDGSKFTTAEFTSADEDRIMEAAMLGGMQGEGNMRYEIAMEKLGLSGGNTLFSTSAAWGPSVSGNVYTILEALGVTIPADPAKLLASVPYIGERGKCKLTPQQALGYAEAIESLKGTEYEAKHALLVDVAGNGIPILLTITNVEIYGLTMWHIVDGAVVRFDCENVVPSLGNICMATYNGKNVIILNTVIDGYGGSRGTAIYECRNGRLVLVRSFFDKFVSGGDDGPDSVEYDYYMDGIAVEHSEQLAEYEHLNWGETLVSYWGSVFGGAYDQQFFTSAADTVKALRTYAAASSAYSFPKAESVDEEALVEAIAKAVADAVGGEISGIYKLADGVYYVLITVDGSTQGTLVTGSRDNGKVVWNVGKPDTAPLSEDELKAILAEIQSKSNLSLDFSTISGIRTEDAVEAIRDQLNNMNGLMPTDPAKSELADFIQSAISSNATITLSGSDNRFCPNSGTVEAIRAEAEKAKGEYEKLLSEYGIELNRPITVIIRIVWNNMDSGTPCQIELNKELFAAMDGCEVQLLMGDTRHYLRISAETLETLTELYGCVKVQMAVDADGIYTIYFLDENDTRIERLETTIGFGLPAETPLATVIVNYEGGSLNWGGQYEAVSRVISFDASYSGRYEIFENAVEISDIDALDEEIRAAIAFLVSKGYMSAEDGLFNPDGELNRYQFSQALVGMFFALDHSLTTGFEDVPADSPFYSYVASGESLDIIKGYDEKHFGGEDGLTTEQMLSLAARTLINYKHYAEPSAPSEYLSSFSDGHEVSDWAQSQVALAVREGLVDRGGELRPADIVTRGEAALILYRLFLLLHEVPTVELELPEVSEPEENDDPAIVEGDQGNSEAKGGAAGTVIAIIIIVAAGAGGAGWWFLKKKKEQTRE